MNAVVQGVVRLVNQRFGGDWQSAFRAYSGGGGEMNVDQVARFLKDAGVWFPGAARTAMQQIDANGSGTLSQIEVGIVIGAHR